MDEKENEFAVQYELKLDFNRDEKGLTVKMNLSKGNVNIQPIPLSSNNVLFQFCDNDDKANFYLGNSSLIIDGHLSSIPEKVVNNTFRLEIMPYCNSLHVEIKIGNTDFGCQYPFSVNGSNRDNLDSSVDPSEDTPVEFNMTPDEGQCGFAINDRNSSSTLYEGSQLLNLDTRKNNKDKPSELQLYFKGKLGVHKKYACIDGDFAKGDNLLFGFYLEDTMPSK